MPDSKPAVYASERIEVAVFMAVLGVRHVGGWGMKDKTEFGFYVVDTDLEKAKRENWAGCVYILPKNDFERRQGWEWQCFYNVEPIDRIEVGIKDLPNYIHIMSQGEYSSYCVEQKQRVADEG